MFGREQAQDHAYTYIKGLMVCPERKSIEPIALNVGDGQVSALQKFINIAPWDRDDVQAELQAVFVDELVPTVAGSPIGTVGVVDESGFAKKGEAQRRRGPATQRPPGQGGQLPGRGLPRGRHPGRLGAAGSSTVLARELVRVRQGRRGAPAAGSTSPRRSPSRPSPQIAAGLIRQTGALGVVALDWVTADEEYGKNGGFLDEVERLELRYVVEVPVSTTVWTADPASCVPPYGGRGRVPTRPTREAVASVAAITSGLGRQAWRTFQVRQGAKGPLAFEFACVRVWAVRHGAAGPPIWLLVRRSLESVPEVKYYVSNADASTPLGVLAEVACTRHEVEDYFEDAKSYLGMAQYETRSWVGWHHHMTLVAMAHLFITLTRRDLGKKRRS